MFYSIFYILYSIFYSIFYITGSIWRVWGHQNGHVGALKIILGTKQPILGAKKAILEPLGRLLGRLGGLLGPLGCLLEASKNKIDFRIDVKTLKCRVPLPLGGGGLGRQNEAKIKPKTSQNLRRFSRPTKLRFKSLLGPSWADLQ